MARKAARTKRARLGEAATASVSRFTAQHGDYRPALATEPGEEPGGRRRSLVRVLINRNVSTVDKWLFEGGPGFEAPQAAAIAHLRGLWRIVENRSRLISRYDGLPLGRRGSDGNGGMAEQHHSALLRLREYQRQFPLYVWQAFENVVRWDEPAGVAGSRLASHPAERRAHAKACVGFVASKIAEWRGYPGAGE